MAVVRAGSVRSGICTASDPRLNTNVKSSPDSLPNPNANSATRPRSSVAMPNPVRRRRSGSPSSSQGSLPGEGASGSVIVVMSAYPPQLVVKVWPAPRPTRMR
jgi:hypothetical protein